MTTSNPPVSPEPSKSTDDFFVGPFSKLYCLPNALPEGTPIFGRFSLQHDDGGDDLNMHSDYISIKISQPLEVKKTRNLQSATFRDHEEESWERNLHEIQVWERELTNVKYSSGNSEHNLEKVIILEKLGDLYYRVQDIKRALACYKYALMLDTQCPILRSRGDLDRWRVGMLYACGSRYMQLHEFERGAAELKHAHSLLKGEVFAENNIDNEMLRARVSVRYGDCLRQLGHPYDALNVTIEAEKAFRIAQNYFHSVEVNFLGAEVMWGLAACLSRISRHQECIEKCDDAIYFLQNQVKSDSSSKSYDELRGLILKTKGDGLEALDRKHEAFLCWTSAVELWEDLREKIDVHHRANLASTYCKMSQFLSFSFFPKPRRWAQKKSQWFVTVLNADSGVPTGDWLRLRELHEEFQARCLAYALSHAGEVPEVVPQILSALQGRGLVAEAVEEAVIGAPEAFGIPEPVRTYARSRAELRALRRGADTALTEQRDKASDPGGRRSRSGAMEVASAPDISADEAAQRRAARIQALEEELPSLRAAAAEVPGFGVLEAPLEALSVERLQAEALAEDEVLVLAMPHAGNAIELQDKTGFVGSFWVLGKTGTPELIESADPDPVQHLQGLHGLPGVLEQFERFCNWVETARGGVRRSARRAANDYAAEAGFSGLSPEEQRDREEAEAEAARVFWSRHAADMARLVWEPLKASGRLDGARRVLLATAGPLHNLPFEAGMAEAGLGDVELVHVNSLAVFALTRGLYRPDRVSAPQVATSQPPGPPVQPVGQALPQAVAALSGTDADIPLAQFEREVVATIWAARLDDPEAVLDGTAYPWQPARPVGFASISCHGDDAPGPDGARCTALSLPLQRDAAAAAGANRLTERSLVQGPRSEALLINACVAGRVYEDIFDGDPTGLVSGALRAGNRTVVAFLAPVPDRLGCVFGIAVSWLMAERGLPLAAAARHARAVLGAGREDAELCAALHWWVGKGVAAHFWPAWAGHAGAGHDAKDIAAMLAQELEALFAMPPDVAHPLRALLVLGVSPDALAAGLAQRAPATQEALADALAALMRLPDPETEPAHCGILKNAAVIFEAGMPEA